MLSSFLQFVQSQLLIFCYILSKNINPWVLQGWLSLCLHKGKSYWAIESIQSNGSSNPNWHWCLATGTSLTAAIYPDWIDSCPLWLWHFPDYRNRPPPPLSCTVIESELNQANSSWFYEQIFRRARRMG